LTIGMDLGDKYSRYCILDACGEVLESGRVATTRSGMERRFGRMEPCRVALEVGTHSPWVQRLLSEAGHEVVVANPRQVRLIYQSASKNDPLDAERLARLARVDPKLLSPVEHRSACRQEALAVLRSRQALVEARTKLVNHVRGTVKSYGSRIKSCSTPSFHRQAATQIPDGLRPALSPVLEVIADLTLRIRRTERQIAQLAEERYPETRLLRAVSGVGALTALWYVLALGDPHRFRRSRSVGAYLGLRPRQSQSGKSDPELHITKAGDKELRRLLVCAAQYILGPFGSDSDLRRFGLAVAARGRKNAKKRAVVAVARKLAVLLHALWTHAEVYEPLRNSQAAA